MLSTTKAKIKTSQKRILMVDDEPDITITLKTALEDSGFFEVDTFNNPVLALSTFRPGLYDLALLDIRMPEINGFELCRKLRDIDSKLRICFLTAANLAYYRETDSDVINDLGIQCFILKPIDNKDLASRLKAILLQK
jgi:DNA-binding response OmpR family regulator